MATRARILADYVSSGVTAAEFDFLDTTSGTPGSGTFLRGDKTWVAAGSTSASDLASGTLAVARMAAGTVIQTAFFSTPVQRSIVSATFNTSDVLGDFDFTPLDEASDILLIAMTNSWVASASSYLYSDFYKDTTDVGFTETANLSGIVRGLAITGPDQGWGVLNYFFLDTCAEATLSTKTYKFSARTHTGTAATIGGLGTDDISTMLIQEIAR
jgi:hypothetical protein